MTNLEKWKEYNRDLASPTSFIDMSFYYLISAALQRRVWLGHERMQLFPNLYIVLVGEPGLGKGLAIRPVRNMLEFHKKDKTKEEKDTETASILKSAVDELKDITDIITKRASFQQDERLLLPIAPETSTFERLVRIMAKSITSLTYKNPDDPNKLNIYVHSSLCFCLEEISSLFRKHTDDVVTFLLTAYDCVDYRKETQTQGIDIIKSPCLAFLGGTTPGFMQRAFTDALLNEGFASRVIFIYETVNRKNTLFYPNLDEKQQQCWKDLCAHILKLTKIFGKVVLSKEAEEFLTNWWKNIHPTNKPNNSPKLAHYYSRKNIHTLKIATVLHFSDSWNDMIISLDECKKALDILEVLEQKMHLALSFGQKNPLSAASDSIQKYLIKHGATRESDLLVEFWDTIDSENFKKVIDFLIKTKQVKPSVDKGILYYTKI